MFPTAGIIRPSAGRLTAVPPGTEREENQMDTINKSIECAVNSCAYHRDHHCTLNTIKVGCCNTDVGKPGETECASFKLGDHGTCCK